MGDSISTAPWAILAMAVAPAVFLLWFFWWRDRWEREPPWLVFGTFLGGVAAGTVMILFWRLLRMEGVIGELDPWFSAVVLAPLLEEPLKISVVMFFLLRHADFNEPMDGVVYGAAAALGFASLENIMYLSDAALQGPDELAHRSILRALVSVPGHAVWTALWGCALGYAKFTPPGRKRRLLLLGTPWVAMAAHAAHNASALMAGESGMENLLLVAFAMWTLLLSVMSDALNVSPFRGMRRSSRES